MRLLSVLLALGWPLTAVHAETGYTNGAVASVHPLATQAGLQALQRGGNAVDAAIATALTLGVVDGHNSGIGGGCFILIRAADGHQTCIDGREKAPAQAHHDMFLREGKVDDAASKTGALASGVPGALAAYELALKKHGKLKLADLLRPILPNKASRSTRSMHASSKGWLTSSPGFPPRPPYCSRLTALL